MRDLIIIACVIGAVSVAIPAAGTWLRLRSLRRKWARRVAVDSNRFCPFCGVVHWDSSGVCSDWLCQAYARPSKTREGVK